MDGSGWVVGNMIEEKTLVPAQLIRQHVLQAITMGVGSPQGIANTPKYEYNMLTGEICIELVPPHPSPLPSLNCRTRTAPHKW